MSGFPPLKKILFSNFFQNFLIYPKFHTFFQFFQIYPKFSREKAARRAAIYLVVAKFLINNLTGPCTQMSEPRGPRLAATARRIRLQLGVLDDAESAPRGLVSSTRAQASSCSWLLLLRGLVFSKVFWMVLSLHPVAW